MKTTIIDGELGWYGNINFMGRSIADANAIRLDSSDFATQLIDVLE